jgi:hypothetical protein
MNIVPRNHKKAPWLTKLCNNVESEVLKKSPIFWDITPCNLLKANRRFRGTFKVEARNQNQADSSFLFGLSFDPGDEGDMLLRNVCWLSTD